jgi:hypothetical protein
VNTLVMHGAIRGDFSWSAGSVPVTILTSPLTLLLGLIAGGLVGVGVGGGPDRQPAGARKSQVSRATTQDRWGARGSNPEPTD